VPAHHNKAPLLSSGALLCPIILPGIDAGNVAGIDCINIVIRRALPDKHFAA
jgi:hypothetical protein